MQIRNLLLGPAVLLALFFSAPFLPSAANEVQAQTQRMTPELLWKLGRVGESAISTDGASVAYSVRRYDLAENKGNSSLFVIPAQGGETQSVLENWPSIDSLQWVQGNLYFLGVDPAGADAGSQLFRWNGEAAPVKLSAVEGGLANLKVAPDAKHIAYTVDVKMDSTVTEIYEDLPQADARIIDQLMFRHWNAWHDFAYSHLHVAPIGDDGIVGEGTDLMEGMRADCPVPPFAGSEHFNWSPDGQEIALTTKVSDRMAESTDTDVYLVSITDPKSMRCITEGQDGYDNDPIYSPDGKFLAYHSMERPGFESDRNRIMIVDRSSGQQFELTEGLDQAATGSVWLPDSSGMVFNSDYRGTVQLFQLKLDSKLLTQISKDVADHHIAGVYPDGKRFLVQKNDMIRSVELFHLNLESGDDSALTHVNDEIFAGLELPTYKEKWVKATDGSQIHCWVVYPPGFDPAKKYPMLTYCQGGPQGQISQFFSYRWNFHLMAANGYVVLAPNRRGLPGFGRAWNDQISGDWGGQAMQDLLSATDAMIAEPYVDAKRLGAVGASFGGYSVYWLMGNSGDRFASMIAHCGVFNMESMYAATEELFFVNWDLGGPYWKSPENRAKYEKFSPNRFIGNWKTPLLVIHGEKDFRVPVNQGLEAFTVAQIENVPSRFLYFPNEGHWVMQPQNGVLWHRVFFDWLDRYLKSDQ